MGLVTGLLTLPLAPVRGTIWVAERLLDEVERQERDPRVVEARLAEAEEAFERDELTADELGLIEEELIARLLPGGKA
jgi:gas vesicle protein GvpG